MNQPSRLAVSTWSLHRTLTVHHVPLLHLPAQAAAHGFGALELVHFHLPSIDPGYLADLRAALDDAHIALHALLIDTGDPTHLDPAQRARDLETMAHWVDIAGALGAATARAVAGHARATPDTLSLSAQGLRPLAAQAEALGLRLTTENWYALLDHPDDVLSLLDRLDGHLGLKVDFGNWPYDPALVDLSRIAPRAESTHAKAFFGPDKAMDSDYFTRCLDLFRAAGFAGTHTLIYDSAPDEWPSLDSMRAITLPYLA